jgi:hypothetical protein
VDKNTKQRASQPAKPHPTHQQWQPPISFNFRPWHMMWMHSGNYGASNHGM